MENYTLNGKTYAAESLEEAIAFAIHEEAKREGQIVRLNERLEKIKARKAYIKSLPNMPNLFSTRQKQDGFMEQLFSEAVSAENQDEEDRIVTLKLRESELDSIQKLVRERQSFINNKRKSMAEELAELTQEDEKLTGLSILITDQFINSQ